MKLLNSFETDSNFWSINPQLEIPKIFADIYKKDKSKNKEKSSKIMWAIALLIDPDSKFANAPYEDRKNLILTDYIRDIKFKWEDYQDAIEYYENLLLTPAQRQINIWSRKMDEKTKYLDSLSYEEDAETIEKLLTSNAKLYTELERITKQLEKEESEGVAKGGREESAGEKGLI
tara:strand:- start:186 stop:710 length:525 start_codon:yes stop_codon:yes gene_type:complete